MQWVPRPIWSLPLWPEYKQQSKDDTSSCHIVFSEQSLYFAHNNQKGCTEDDSIATILLADGISFVTVRNVQNTNSSLLRGNSIEQQSGKFLHIIPYFRNIFNYTSTKSVTELLFDLSQIFQEIRFYF